MDSSSSTTQFKRKMAICYNFIEFRVMSLQSLERLLCFFSMVCLAVQQPGSSTTLNWLQLFKWYEMAMTCGLETIEERPLAGIIQG